MVYKFNGNSWEKLGVPFVTTDQVSSQSIGFDNNGILHLAFADWGNAKKATIVKHDGTNWTVVGDVASKGAAEYISIAFSGSNIPYLAYRDNYNMRRTTVMKLDNSTKTINIESAYELKVYPNPGDGLFTLDLGDIQVKKAKIEVFNSVGQIVFSRNQEFSNKMVIDLHGQENGIYFLKVTNNETVHSKAIKISRFN